MTRKQQQNKKKKEKRKRPRQIVASTIVDTRQSADEEGNNKPHHRNFLADAGPGCYIARRDIPTDWIIEWEDIDLDDFDDDKTDMPDIAVDIDEQTLSICNVQEYATIAYVTVYETPVRGANGERLSPGTTTDSKGLCESCVTFIVLCPPCVFVHLCFLDVQDGQDITSLRIDSHVSPWEKHPHPTDEHPHRLGFPLSGGPFLCTQGEGGELTHFFSGNLHAIDFRCPIGTELLSVSDGVVVDVKDHNTLTGIAVTNLFEWNSIIIQVVEEEIQGDQHDDGGNNTNRIEVPCSIRGGPLFVEYVHIQTSLVQVGDQVTKGQIIGRSGSVGFSPEPHLHFSAFRSSDPIAPTVRVHFQCHGMEDNTATTPTKDNNNTTTTTNSSKNTTVQHYFLPQAGRWYDSSGEVKERNDMTE
jgi:hypothetical protein